MMRDFREYMKWIVPTLVLMGAFGYAASIGVSSPGEVSAGNRVRRTGDTMTGTLTNTHATLALQLVSDSSICWKTGGTNCVRYEPDVDALLTAANVWLGGSTVTVDGSISMTSASGHITNTGGAVLLNDANGITIGNGTGTDADGVLTAGRLWTNMDSSTTAAPAQMGFTNESANEASRFFVTGSDGFQGGSGQRLQLMSWWGLDIHGHRESSFGSFVAGGATDTDVRVVGATTDDDVFAVDGASGLTADLQEWRVNGTTISKMTAGGSLVLPTSSTLNLDGTSNGDNGLQWTGTSGAWRVGAGSAITATPSASRMTISSGYILVTGKIANASLPTCDATNEGAIVYDTTNNAHYACNDKDGSLGWDPMY